MKSKHRVRVSVVIEFDMEFVPGKFYDPKDFVDMLVRDAVQSVPHYHPELVESSVSEVTPGPVPAKVTHELLKQVAELLRKQGIAFAELGDKLTFGSAFGDDDVEILYVPEEFSGIKGGTIDISFVSRDEFEGRFECENSTAEEIAKAAVDLVSAS